MVSKNVREKIKYKHNSPESSFRNCHPNLNDRNRI